MTATTIDATQAPRRWDPIVRITHWGIVLAVIGNALLTEGGSGVHVWIGYALAALLALRLLWGVIGPAEARFSAFPPSLRRALEHIREIRSGRKVPYRSHNPLGALMVYAVWACLGVIVATGIAMAGPPPANPLAPRTHAERAQGDETARASGEDEDEAGEREESPIAELHETAAYLLYLLIALHLMGVVFETRRSGRQIVGAMLPVPIRPDPK